MYEKNIIVDLGDGKQMSIKFVRDAETGDWHSTMSDELMCDLCFYYPQIVKEVTNV